MTISVDSYSLMQTTSNSATDRHGSDNDWALDGIKYSEILNPPAHNPCANCSSFPKNGGSVICNCTLNLPKVTC